MKFCQKCWDHSQLDTLNKRAARKGFGPIFDEVDSVAAKDNGEKFGSLHYEEQQERNNTCGSNNHSICNCSECKDYLAFVTEEPAPLDTIDEDVEMEIPVQPEKKSEPPKVVAPLAPAFPPQPMHQYPLYPYYQHVPPPDDACFDFPPFCCGECFDVVQRRNLGEKVRGRPKHSKLCKVSIERRNHNKPCTYI